MNIFGLFGKEENVSFFFFYYFALFAIWTACAVYMYVCGCFWSSFHFKEKVSVKRNEVLVLKVRGELPCMLWKVESLSSAVAAGTTHCCRRWAATPRGSVGRPSPWAEWRRPGSRAALNSGQTPPPTPWPPELQPRHSGAKGSGTQVRQHSTASCLVSAIRALIGSEVKVFELVFGVCHQALSLQCCLGKLVRLKRKQNWQKLIWEIPRWTVYFFLYFIQESNELMPSVKRRLCGCSSLFSTLAAKIKPAANKIWSTRGHIFGMETISSVTITSLPWSKERKIRLRKWPLSRPISLFN